jgi:hypothetical protein
MVLAKEKIRGGGGSVNALNTNGESVVAGDVPLGTFSNVVQSAGGSETRPANASVNYIIKY